MARIDAMVNVHAHVTVSDANLAASGTRTRVRAVWHAFACHHILQTSIIKWSRWLPSCLPLFSMTVCAVQLG